MDDEIVRINERRLLTYIRRNLKKSFDLDKPGWDPEEAYRIISRTVEERFSSGYGVNVKLPTKEQLVALRLMGHDLKSSLHLTIEFTPPTPAEFVRMRIVLGDKTQ